MTAKARAFSGNPRSARRRSLMSPQKSECCRGRVRTASYVYRSCCGSCPKGASATFQSVWTYPKHTVIRAISIPFCMTFSIP